MSRFEIELPARWPPCPHCQSHERVAVARLDYGTIGFYCAGETLHPLPWSGRADGATQIPHAVFLPGGAFAGLIPASQLDPPAASGGERRFAPAERRQEWIRSEQRACALCGVAPLRDWAEPEQLLAWLRARNAPEIRDVIAILGTTRPPLTRRTWYRYCVRHHFDLVARVNFRVADSFLRPQPSIAPDILRAMWPRWPPELRRVAGNTLAFGFCRACCRRRSPLPSRDELLRRHIACNYDGSEAAAVADSQMWLRVLRVVHSLDDHRAALSERDAVP